MAKLITTTTRTALSRSLTFLASAWIVDRTDGRKFRLTTNTRDVEIDVGDGLGPQTYSAREGYSRTNLSNDAEMNVANTDVAAIFDDAQLKEDELRRGLFDGAEVRIFLFDWSDPGAGVIKMLRGEFAQTRITGKGWFELELRDLTQVFLKEFGEFYSKDCRDDLGGFRCTKPVLPPVLLPGEELDLVGTDDLRVDGRRDYVGMPVRRRVVTDPPAGYVTDLGPINGDLDLGDTSGWVVVSGTWAAVTDFAGLVPQGGTHFLRMTEQTGSTRQIRQDIDLAALIPDLDTLRAGKYWLALSFFRANSDIGDLGRVQLQALDAAGAVLQTLDDTGSEAISPLDSWSLRTLAGVVPALAVTARVLVSVTRTTGLDVDAAFDSFELSATDMAMIVPSQSFEDRSYLVTAAGVTRAATPTYDTIVGNPTTDGTATLVAEEAITRAFEVVSVSEPRRKFKVSELTPAATFPTGRFNAGVVFFETGLNAGRGMEIRAHVADDGMTIEQEVELFEDLPFDVSVGDRGRATPGCNHTFAMCVDVHDNGINFVGEKDVPSDDKLSQTPDAR